MATLLPDLLVMDHLRIKSLARELTADCDKDPVDKRACFNLFRTFKALLTAHAKSEEYTVYALFDLGKSRSHEDLRDLVFEGYEEHDLVDLLLKEMGQAEEITPQWRAKLKVVLDLLNHHVQREEQKFLPKVRAVVAADELLALGVVYLRERDEVFAKKSGMKKPAHPTSTLMLPGPT